jgi:hypothetical protein
MVREAATPVIETLRGQLRGHGHRHSAILIARCAAIPVSYLWARAAFTRPPARGT